MKWLSNASIDALGNSLIKNYMGQKLNGILSVDIEGFVQEYLKLPLMYHHFAEDDMTKLGFISDGKTPLNIFFGHRVVQKVFPKGTIVIEEYLKNKSETGRRRFTIAHEAAHYIMDRSLATASFHRECDSEKTYSPEIDKRQVRKYIGKVSCDEMENISECIEKSLGLYIPEEMEAP